MIVSILVVKYVKTKGEFSLALFVTKFMVSFSMKVDYEEKIKGEIELQRQNEKWIEPDPAWLRGEQQVTGMNHKL